MRVLDRIKAAFEPAAVEPAHTPLGSDYRALFSAIGLGSDGLASSWDGDTFFGGFGETKDYTWGGIDYWTLRLRSKQLFTENLYANGLINRLVTNEIHTGLQLEAEPDGDLLGMTDDQVNVWSENTEKLFRIYGNASEQVDWAEQETFGQLQSAVRKIALLSGDVLVVLHQSRSTNLPRIELVDGSAVQNPLADGARAAKVRGNTIVHGVEVNPRTKRQVAYFVRQANGTHKRIPTKGARSGRTLAFMVYGLQRMPWETRGMPLLGVVLQSLKELDRYRAAELRAATINALVAAWVEKTDDKVSTKPFSAGAMRRTTVTTDNPDTGASRNLNFGTGLPGMVIEELSKGEKVNSFDTKRPNVNMQVFEDTVVSAIAWCVQTPPEILKLSFNNNYSASRAAINEFRIYLDKARSDFSDQFNKIFYREWLVSMVLKGRISAPGMLQARLRSSELFTFYAWLQSDWAGAIKPGVDREKDAKAYTRMVNQGFITRERACKELTGMRYSEVVRRLKKENAQLVEANRPLVQAGLLGTAADAAGGVSAAVRDFIGETVDNLRDDIEGGRDV